LTPFSGRRSPLRTCRQRFVCQKRIIHSICLGKA
jgi:hypothetical protein